MVEIDGSYGEGGGQILRTALSLSCLLNKPFRIYNIRKGRKRPGLMPQHLTCVRAAQILSDARVKGDYKGSSELIFSPGEIKGGDFSFDIGTAGSTSLVLQTIIPALLRQKKETGLTLKGGTHVPLSPTFHYIKEIFAPLMERLGIKIRLTIEAYGFYPKGGGIIKAAIFPANRIRPLRIVQRGRIINIKGYSGVGNLPLSIAERQKNAVLDNIRLSISGHLFPLNIEAVDVPSPGQGTFVFMQAESENSLAGFSSIGERGKRAESVGEDAAREFLQYYSTDAAFDPHLSDQIVLYLSMCEEGSLFTASCITRHLITNLWVIGLFHEYKYSIRGDTGKPGTVEIN